MLGCLCIGLIDDNVIQKTHNPIVLKLCHSNLFKFPIGIDSIVDGIDGKFSR